MVTILFIAFVILLLIGVPIAVSLGIASVLAIFFVKLLLEVTGVIS